LIGARVDFCEVVGPILRNALDASAAGGSVDVDVRLDAGRLETRVHVLRIVVRMGGVDRRGDAEVLRDVDIPCHADPETI
jgi:hypothetical protein